MLYCVPHSTVDDKRQRLDMHPGRRSVRSDRSPSAIVGVVCATYHIKAVSNKWVNRAGIYFTHQNPSIDPTPPFIRRDLKNIDGKYLLSRLKIFRFQIQREIFLSRYTVRMLLLLFYISIYLDSTSRLMCPTDKLIFINEI